VHLRSPVVSRRQSKIFASALVGLGGVCGCAESDVTPPATVQPAVMPIAASVTPTYPTSTGSEIEVTPTSAVGEPTAASAPDAPNAASAEPYTPPFPDRVDLFVPPKRQGSSQSHDSSERAVELMGFVRVDRPRAILSINGQVSPLAEGESVDGIEVISVQPPSVLLQRGRQRWQATIE
jgi:hypothetical protein